MLTKWIYEFEITDLNTNHISTIRIIANNYEIAIDKLELYHKNIKGLQAKFIDCYICIE